MPCPPRVGPTTSAIEQRNDMQRRLISSGSTFEENIGYSRAVVQGDWVFVSEVTALRVTG